MAEARTRTDLRKAALRRYLAFSIDWLVILAWGGLLFAGVMFVYQGQPSAPSGPWTAQLLGFFSMTLPVILYFSLSEASPWRGSLGKRLLALRLETITGDRVPFRSTLLRNLVKFSPWECGHVVAQQSFFSTEAGIPLWVYVPMTISFLGPIWWVISIFRRGQSPYDRLVAVQVLSGNGHGGK